ncbi:vacuolar ATP synthetase [Cardiosporidium cionae]|uniref:V-type proton ATPase proteolipid subunit n=1 Tax=Cardiosporidium cionae TaxID=476202 RepID=A0ABQ7J5J0_9APIC|nr:vacuolar ATP synthetase [Cardiosporidium cionae]|eukprot:KAF8819246.1 vacuolar ATP synthetase [Cardiosporidium cionae]
MTVCDPNSVFFGIMGITSALVFANLGGAYGTAKTGVGICSMGVMRPDLVVKSLLSPILAGVLGIYGLIVGIILQGKLTNLSLYSAFDGYAHLGAGLICGLSALAAGLSIGIIGDAGVRANAQQPRIYVAMVLMLIFSEALAIYGLIMAILLASKTEAGLCSSFAVV